MVHNMPRPLFDAVDREILALLQRDGRLANAELARAVRLSPTASLRRLKALESDGVIAGYHADLDRARLGLPLTVFMAITVDHSEPSGASIEEALTRIEHLVSCHVVNGEADYLAELAVPDLETFEHVLRHQILSIPAVREARSTFSIRSLKPATTLPLTSWTRAPA